MPPSRLSTTNTGADGPIALAIGIDRVVLGRPARSLTVPSASIRSACSTDSAHPSATVAARIERRSGSQTSAHSISGPQCSSILPGHLRDEGPGRGDVHQHAARSGPGAAPPRRWPRRCRPPAARTSRSRAATRSSCPSAGIRQSTCSTGVGLIADRIGEQRQAHVDDGYLVRQHDGAALGSVIMRSSTARRSAWPDRAVAPRPRSSRCRRRSTAAPRSSAFCQHCAIIDSHSGRGRAAGPGPALDDRREDRAPRSGPSRPGPTLARSRRARPRRAWRR